MRIPPTDKPLQNILGLGEPYGDCALYVGQLTLNRWYEHLDKEGLPAENEGESPPDRRTDVAI
jgi:hypothetical protein